MNKLSISISVFLAFCLVISCGKSQEVIKLDRFEIYTTFGMFHSEEAIPCGEDGLIDRNIGLVFSIENPTYIKQLNHEIKQLNKDENGAVVNYDMNLIGYKNNEEHLQICASAIFKGYYVVNGELHKESSKLDSLLATILLEKYIKNEFTCDNQNEGCADIKKGFADMENKWKIVSTMLKNNAIGHEKGTAKEVSENYINVRFIQENTTYPIRMDCISSDIEESVEEIFFKKITDTIFIKQFVETYQEFKPSTENHSTDFRITAFVHQKDKKTDTLCFGEDYGTYLNGAKMDDNSLLLYALKKQISYETTFRTKE